MSSRSRCFDPPSRPPPEWRRRGVMEIHRPRPGDDRPAAVAVSWAPVQQHIDSPARSADGASGRTRELRAEDGSIAISCKLPSAGPHSTRSTPKSQNGSTMPNSQHKKFDTFEPRVVTPAGLDGLLGKPVHMIDAVTAKVSAPCIWQPLPLSASGRTRAPWDLLHRVDGCKNRLKALKCSGRRMEV
jgi:hypothetical protein